MHPGSDLPISTVTGDGHFTRIAVSGVPVQICWRKRIFVCRHPWCEQKTWTETSDAIPPRSAMTERARRWAFEQVGRRDWSVAAVAGELGVGWHTVMREVRRRGEPIIDDAPASTPTGPG